MLARPVASRTVARARLSCPRTQTTLHKQQGQKYNISTSTFKTNRNHQKRVSCFGNSSKSYYSTGSESSPKPQRSTSRRWVVGFARTTLAVVLGIAGYVVYDGYHARNPTAQLEHDPSKKNLVVLGNGWGATSFLKSLDTEGYNVTVISPRNFFLFTPLLPSVTVGTVEYRSIIQPTRYIIRHKKRAVNFIEGEAHDVDPNNKTITFSDASGNQNSISYDALVYAVGAENSTFGIPGVAEHGNFLKEVWDAEKIRKRLIDCLEKASFAGVSKEERKRLLHMVVVGGGPTGVEYAAELRDFLVEDLSHWYPECVNSFSITLVEALPNILPMFSKQLIDYTSQTFKSNDIQVLTKTMVKGVDETTIKAQNEKKEIVEIPYGLLVWATGNTTRIVTRNLMKHLGPDVQNQRRGLAIDSHLEVKGAEGSIWALGDCTATQYAPTAQAASQQGQYLARIFNQMAKKDTCEAALEEAKQSNNTDEVQSLSKQLSRLSKYREFAYSHQGSLAYIGSEKAIADIDVPYLHGNIATGGFMTMLFWRSAFISNLFSTRNKTLVLLDWLKVKIFGRDVSRE